jgi:predicted RNase H-like nuclease (RuvC/YqgF family)
MEAKLRFLEERVTRAVERMRALARERDRLRKQVEELRERLTAMQPQMTPPGDPADGPWRLRSEEVVETLRQAIAELRGP